MLNMNMKYHRLKDNIILRLVKGESIFDSIYKLIEKEKIVSGWVHGIGAIENVKIGSYNLSEKKYNQIDLKGIYELTSLTGNITTKEGRPFLHLHVNVADHNCTAYGGHLFDANINATGEFIINAFNDNIIREYDSEIGLFLMEFDSCGK